MNLIFLIGMMGAGKTYWSRAWADECGCHVVDMDEQIAEEAGKTVAQIFEEDGEEVFRATEQRILSNIIHILAMATLPEVGIIACGGGTPCYFDNLDRMKAAGCVIYLQASVDELMHNLAHESAVRPMLSGDMKMRLTQLLTERSPIYEQADHIIPVKNITATTFAEILAACTNRHL